MDAIYNCNNNGHLKKNYEHIYMENWTKDDIRLKSARMRADLGVKSMLQ